MGYFDSDGNYQPDDSDYTPSYDAGGGGSSWGDNAPQLPPPSNFWGSLGDAIGGVAQQLQQGYDAGGGGSSWGDTQPDYSWTSPAPDYSQPDYSQPDYSTPSFDWGGGGSYWGDQQPSYDWTYQNPNADFNYWDSGQDFTAAEPTPQQLPDNTPFWDLAGTGFDTQYYGDFSQAPQQQPDQNQPLDLGALQQYDNYGLQTYSPWDKAAQNAGNFFSGVANFFGNHSAGPTLYTPQAMINQSQNQYNPTALDSSLQRQQANQMAEDINSAMGNTFGAVGQAVTNTGQANVPFISDAANFVRGAWENVAEPVMGFTPSIVGDISQGQVPGVFGDIWNYWTQPGYTQQMQQEKTGYVQDAYNQALQSGLTPDQAAQVAQQLDNKLNNFANLAEYRGLQRFGTLPAIAQLGIGLLDPVANQFGEMAFAGKLPKPLAETGIGKRVEQGLGYVAPIPAAGKVAGLAADTFRLGDLGNYIGKKLESPQQKAHNFEMAQQDLTPTFEQIADQTGVSPLEVEQRFTSDPNFRQQLGFTGKYKQVGDDIAQSYREAEAQSYANKYEWDKAQPTEELKPDESKFAVEAQQTAATPAPDLVKQRDAYRSALKDEMAAKYEAEGMKPTEASVQAEIDSRQVTTKLRTPEAIEQFKKDYPTAYEKGQAKFEKQQTRNQAKATAKAEAAPKEEAEINAKREAYNQSLKEKYADQFEKQGQDRGTALDNAAIRARVESDKLTSKKAIADFEKVNPDVVKNAENYLEFDTFKSGADQATQLKEKYASVQRPAHLKAMKVPKEWAALTPAERLDFAKQNYGLKVKALKVDEFGKVVPTKNLEQFGKAGKLLKGPGFLSEYMSRAMLNSPGRLVRDPAGNVVKAFLEGHNPFGGRKQGDILDRLGIERPEQLAGSIRKDLETSTKKPGFIKNAAYAAINPAGEAASLLVRKVTKGKIKDINEAVEHLETGIKGKVYDDAALKAYKQSIQSQLDNGILKNLTPELQKALQDGKLTREQIQQFAAGQLDKGNLAKAIDGDYHLQNYSPDITNTVDKLQDEGNIFASGVKDFFDELPGDVKPDSPEFRDAVQKARQYQDGVFTSFVKKEAEEIQKAKADPAVANAVQFPSFMKQVLENEQARRESYYQTFQGKDIISQREAVKGKAKPAQAAEPAPKKAEYTPTPDTVAYGTDPSKVYPLKFKVVSLDDLIPSNTDMGGVNPNYNVPGLQPRLRDRQASIRQIDQTAKKLNPDALLTDFKQLDKGAPITGPDRMVESGNGRTLALRKARTDYPEKWAEYQDKLKQTLPQYGIDPASLKGIKDPVLVRERSGNVTDRAAFAKEANESGTLRMSTLENAIQDAKLISDDQLLRFKVGEEQPIDVALRSAANRDFVRDFLGSLPENEAAALKRGDGSLNQQGLQRAKAAMLAKLFPGEAGTRLAETFLEALDSTTKNFENSITATMPKLSRMEALISSGQRDAKLSITSDVANAIDVLSYLKEAGIKPSDYLHQASFGIEGMEKKLTPFQDYLLDYFDTIGSKPKSIREFFNDYADAVEAAPDPNQSTMFGDFDRPTKEQLVERITGRKAPPPQADTATPPDAELARPGTGSTATTEPAPPAETPKAPAVLRPAATPTPKTNKLKAYYDAIYNPVRSDIPAPGALRAMAAKFNRVDKAQRARYMQTFLDADENIRQVTGNTYKLDTQTFEPVRISDGKPLRESYLKQRAAINKQEPPEIETAPVETGKPAPETLLDPAKRQELLDLSEKVFGKGSDGAVKMQTALDTVSQKLNEFGIDPTKPFEKMTQAEKDLAMSIIARESGLPDATDVHVSYQSLKEQHAASSDLINQFQEDARKRYEQSQQAKVQKAEQAAQQRIDTERLVDQIAEAAATARARAVLDAKRAGFDEANRIYFDYNNKNILDQALTNWIPFNFWARQNFVYLAKHFAAHPMHFAALVNFYNQLQEENRKNGIPDYLRGDILLWTNPDGSKVMWNYSNMLPINPFGETDQTMNIVDATDADTSKSTNKTPLMVLFGYDKKNSKGEITGREKGVIPSFLRPNPIIDTVTKTGAISDFLNKMGYTTDRIGSPGPVEKQTLGLLPGRSMWQAVGAATGLTKELRKMIPGMSDLDIEGPINSYLFGKTSGKPMTALDQQLALMAQNKEISADQAKLAIAGIKEGNWTPAALAALDRIETKESMPMRILSIGGLSTVLTNTPREQSAKAVSQAYSQVDKGDKTAVKNFFDQNPGAEVSFSASKSPDEIRQGIKDGKTAQQLSQLTQQVKDKQISSKEYNAAVDKLKADNPGYKWKETTPEQTAKNQYFDQLDQYKAIGGDRYDQLSKEIQDKYNSGDKKGAAAISNSKEYQQMKAARDQFLKDNPDFADQYNKSITDKYGPQKPAKSEADATYQNQFDQYNNIGGGKWKDLTAQISEAQARGDKKAVAQIMGSDEYQRLKNARDQFLLDHPDFYDQYKQELEAKGYKAPAIGSIKTSSNTPSSSATSGRATSSYSRPASSGGKSYTPTKKTYTTNYSSKSTYTTAKKPYTTSYSSKGASTYPAPKKAATTSYNASGPKSIEQIRTELRKPLALPKPSVYSESGYQKVTSSANKSSTLQSSAKYSRYGFKYLPPPKQTYSKGGGGKPSGKTYTRPGSSYSKNGIQLYSRGRGKF